MHHFKYLTCNLHHPTKRYLYYEKIVFLKKIFICTIDKIIRLDNSNNLRKAVIIGLSKVFV